MHAFGWSNLEERISAYLSQPERYPLVVPDYYGAGLWRNPGTRGAAFLFLRSCVSHADSGVIQRLVQSPLRGTSNIETATGRPFSELFREATVDLLDRRNYGTLDKDRRGPLLCGPRFHELSLAKGNAEASVAGTAAVFFLLHSPAQRFSRVAVDGTGPLQVTLVPLPRKTPRLKLGWRQAKEGLIFEATAEHGELDLRGAGWEGTTEMDQLRSNVSTWFRAGHLKIAETSHSVCLVPPYPSGGSAPLFRVLAEDALGQAIAGWLQAPSPSELKK